jgi:hypothetical protein
VEIARGEVLGCKVDVGGLSTGMTSASLWSDWHCEDGHCHAYTVSNAYIIKTYITRVFIRYELYDLGLK